MQNQVAEFLDGSPHAVVGASQNRDKYGNKVLRAYLQNDRDVVPINPKEEEIEGLPVCKSLSDCPEGLHGISVVTPPQVTEAVIEEAGRVGIKHVWLQPGAESDQAVARAEELGMNIIAGGPCVLVTLQYREP